jgi:MSHA biogenesis protein MshL
MTPDYVPAQEDISPLKTRIVDLAARNTPLRDVLFIVAEATGLNLVMDRNVSPEIPVTLNLKNVTAEDALNRIFTSVDYFYVIKDNMLLIKATETKTFELGHPAVVQTYSTDMGGDILGAAMSGGAGGAAGGSHLKGAISQKTESDKSAFNFWETIEKSIEKILGPAGDASASVQQSFSVNRLMGTIVVTATRKNLEKVENYIETIKKVMNRQVLVEAKVIEVALSDSLQFGIDWNSLLTFNDIRTANFAGIAAPTASSPVFIAGTTAADFSALLKAIQVQGETRILSNPRLNIMNGQTAILGVGRNTSYISKMETTQQNVAGTAPTITFTVDTGSVLSGIMIGIVPYISESGEISLSITPIISDLVKLDSQSFGETDTAGNRPYLIQLPQIDLRQMSTTVKVRSGQTVIIGGLISKREGVADSQVPAIGDIPILGYFFKSRDKSVKKTELVLLIQPIIISR